MAQTLMSIFCKTAQPPRVSGRGASLHIAEKFFYFEKKNSCRRLQGAPAVKLVTQFRENHPYPAKHPRAFKAEILAVTHSFAAVMQHPAKNQSPERMPR